VLRSHGGGASLGKLGYSVGCVAAALVLVLSGFTYYVKAQIGSIGGSNVLTGGPQVGAMNILLMGLESRTDYDGNVLPPAILDALHAGSEQGVQDEGVGGQDTNTLILIHIFAGGQHAVGFSIPRDDWITFPKPYDGQSQGKIDQAYGLAWAQSLNQTVNSGMSRDQRYLEANEAGQAATIATVQQLTGVHVDHFAEVNLAGFYELAKSFGGVEACLKSWNGGQNLHDANSGFNQQHAGYVLLSPGQTLAFVRERDNLPNGDLDRTHRQQAVIDYVIWKLEHDGVFSDLGQLTSLLDVAKEYVITDSGWQILSFAGEMKSLSGKNLTFQTAPVITTDGQEDGQTVNLIDPAAIKHLVQTTFNPPPSAKHPKKPASTSPSLAPGSTAVDVYNGGQAPGLAAALSQALTSAGFKAGKVGNIAARASTEVLYGKGGQGSASKIASYFDGVSAVAGGSVAAGHVEVLLGADATSVPSGITPGSAATSPGSTPSTSPTSASNNGQAGAPVTVSANAKYGIPCVY
jgi:LCP family protein required for cell wall assembly